MEFIKEHKTGFIGTIITHAVVLALLLFFGFFTKLPLPQEEGILVNFGDSETGLGLEEPAPGESAPIKDQEEIRVKAQTAPPSPQKKVATPVEREALLTQDMEKTVAMETAKMEKEADRIRKTELARQKKEEEQKMAIAAAEERKAGEINSRAKSAFGGNGKGSPDSKSTSQGVTFGTGNQGSPQGSANADKYGPGGGVGTGPSFSLEGRGSLSLPKPYYPGNEEGIVVVQVTVDKNGTITKAEPGVKGSNTANPELIAAAKKAALQAKFNVDNNAPAYQVGTITYRFVLD